MRRPQPKSHQLLHLPSLRSGLPIAMAAMLAVSFVLPAPGAAAAASAGGVTYVVTTTVDTNDGRCDTQCSVREAILAANAHPGADTVRIPAGTYDLGIPGAGEDAGATGDLDITDAVAVKGAGESRTVLSAAGIDRVLQVFGGPTSISGVTITHGLAPANSGGGGGIRVDAETVTLSHVIVADNATVEGITGDSEGGGIKTSGLAGDINLTLTRVRITGNRAQYGAGIAVDTGGAAMSHVHVTGNIAAGPGGGVYNSDSRTTLTDSVIDGNRAGDAGGGLINIGDFRDGLPAQMTMTRVQVSGNNANGNGGGLSNLSGGSTTIADSIFTGNRAMTGAFAFNADQLDVGNSTVSGNTSAAGGALVNDGADPLDHYTTPGTGTLLNVTFADNSAGIQNLPLSGTETVTNTILSNRRQNCTRTSDAGLISSGGGNLDSGRTCHFAATHDRSAVNPRLAALADNGGPTLTQALRAGSPARDRALDAACPTHDQRGAHRPRGPHCDIGAFEAAPVP